MLTNKLPLIVCGEGSRAGLGAICQPVLANVQWLHGPFLQGDTQNRLKGIAAPFRGRNSVINTGLKENRPALNALGSEGRFPGSRAKKKPTRDGLVHFSLPRDLSSTSHL